MLSGLDPDERVFVVLAVVLALYVLSGLVWPYTKCKACKDKGGRFLSPSGRNFRKCGSCGGSQTKLRWIARLLGRDD